MAMTSYERVIPIKRLPYWTFWPIVGFLLLIAGELLGRVYNTHRYFWTRFLASAAIGLLPIAYTAFLRGFRKAMRAVWTTFWTSESEFEDWLERKLRKIFTLESWQAKLVTGVITFPGLATVMVLGVPSRHLILKAFGLLFLAAVLFVCGQALYICMDLLAVLREIVWRPHRVPFFSMAHRVISTLQNFYSVVAFVVTFAYVCLAVAIWRGPYGLAVPMQIWLTALAFYPLSIFLWSYFQLHVLMQNIKYCHLDIINTEVQSCLAKVLYNYSLEDAQRLQTILDVQVKVQSAREWPFTVQGVLPFVVALLAAAAQVVIAVLKTNRP